MSMNENVITLRFTNRVAAYQALGALRHLNAAGAEIHGAVLVERPDDGAAVVLAAVGESGTDTLDMLALWYGSVLERRPVDGVRAELKAMEEAAEQVRKEEAKARREQKRAEVAQKFHRVTGGRREGEAAPEETPAGCRDTGEGAARHPRRGGPGAGLMAPPGPRRAGATAGRAQCTLAHSPRTDLRQSALAGVTGTCIYAEPRGK